MLCRSRGTRVTSVWIKLCQISVLGPESRLGFGYDGVISFLKGFPDLETTSWTCLLCMTAQLWISMMRYMSFSLVIGSASYKPAAKLPSEPCWVLSSIAVSQSYNPLWHEKFFRIILAKCVYKWSYTSDVPFAHIKGSILSLPGASVCSQVQSQGESDLAFITGTLTLIPAPWLRTTQVQSSSQLWSSQCRPDTSRWGSLKNLWPVCYPCSWRTNCSAAVWPVCTDAALGLVLGKSSVVKYDSLCLSSNLCVFDKTFIFQCMLRMLGGGRKKKADFIVCKLIVEIVT